MNINIFNPDHLLHQFRWFILSVGISGCVLAYYDYTGGRIFTFSEQETWNSSGPGYHK